ncbi:MAG TPA: hypothetical protein ENI27_02255 [bacterium]|nr:hypothetical protein [bacterium]
MSRDTNIKRNDQIKLLSACAKYSDTGDWCGEFTYPNCGWDLVQQGLVADDKKITPAGRAALWLLDKGEDPTDSRVSIEFKIPIEEAQCKKETE